MRIGRDIHACTTPRQERLALELIIFGAFGVLIYRFGADCARYPRLPHAPTGEPGAGIILIFHLGATVTLLGADGVRYPLVG